MKRQTFSKEGLITMLLILGLGIYVTSNGSPYLGLVFAYWSGAGLFTEVFNWVPPRLRAGKRKEK